MWHHIILCTDGTFIDAFLGMLFPTFQKEVIVLWSILHITVNFFSWWGYRSILSLVHNWRLNISSFSSSTSDCWCHCSHMQPWWGGGGQYCNHHDDDDDHDNIVDEIRSNALQNMMQSLKFCTKSNIDVTIFRIAKVFSQPGVADLVRNGEAGLDRGNKGDDKSRSSRL